MKTTGESRTAPPAADERIPELDGVRGLAILLVLIWHFLGTLLPAASEPLWRVFQSALSMCWTGVDLFFVLSGFLIGGILMDQRSSPRYFATFYLRRVLRIFPLYYFYILLFVALLPLLARFRPGLGEFFTEPLPLWSYVLYVQNVLMADRLSYGGNWFGITWSLAIEEQFYILFPLLVWWVRPRALPAVLLGGIGLAVGLRQAWPALTNMTLMPWRMDALLLGALLARAYRMPALMAWVRRRVWVLYLGLGATLAVMLLFRLSRLGAGSFYYLLIALGYAWVLALALVHGNGPVARVMRWAWLRWLGQVAYGLYIYHEAVLAIVFFALVGHAPGLASASDAGCALLALLVTLGVAQASFTLFERRFIRYGHRFRY